VLYAGEYTSPNAKAVGLMRKSSQDSKLLVESGSRGGRSTAVPHNLPTPRVRLIGRESDVASLRDLLIQVPGRLVTLTGPGGCGKTQLALHAAKEVAPFLADGDWLVDLAQAHDESQVPYVVAAALRLRGRARQTIEEAVVAHLRARNQLLVLDNCEHVIDACARLVDRVLEMCPSLRVLATSRERLRIVGETVWHVSPLVCPELNSVAAVADAYASAAVRLFVERAQAANPEFTLSATNMSAVVSICSRLEGMPLAIELAAARVTALSPAQVLEQLDDSLALLVRGNRNAVPRHQSLAATLDWSWRLLSHEEQLVFGRLAVFAEGSTLEAVEAVCSDGPRNHIRAPDLLAQLVDKSMLIAGERQGRSRYRLLEPLRQYAWSQLEARGEVASVRRHHATYYLEFAESLEHDANVGGAGRIAAIEALEIEYPNLMRALMWALEMREADPALRLARTVQFIWKFRRPLAEGYMWIQKVLQLDAPSLAMPARVVALVTAARLADGLGEHAAAEVYFGEALPLARRLGDPWILFLALVDEGIGAAAVGDYARARRRWQEGLLSTRSNADRASEAILLFALGTLAIYEGDRAAGRALCERARRLAVEAGDAWVISLAREIVALGALVQGELSSARTLAKESVEDAQDPFAAMRALTTLAEVALLQERLNDARLHLVEALKRVRDEDDWYAMPRLLEAVAHFAARRGMPDVALRIIASMESVGSAYWCGRPAEVALRDQWLEPLRRDLAPDIVERCSEEGRELPLATARELAQVVLAQTISTEEPQQNGNLLTARQAEVAVLVAQGMTNRQIGQHLVITERAAAAHVEHILDRLGVGSRAQIAAWATARGMVTQSDS